MNLICVLVILQICLLYSIQGYSPDGRLSRRAVADTSTDYKNFDPSKELSWFLLDHHLCGNSLADRIIGGINATLGQYPWIARIGYISLKQPNNKPEFRCGASLIHKNYVITAAHCVINLPNNFKVAVVRLGEYDTTKEVDCYQEECADPVQDVEPAQIIIHEEYGNPAFGHDIALIRLQTPIKFNKWVLPICLPWGLLMTRNFSSEYVDVAGWGHYDMTRPVGSVVLQTVKLPIINSTRCKRAFRRIDLSEESQMCVGGEKGKDSCNGDSGGPMMKVEVVNGPPKYYLVGIVSFGVRNCGSTPTPGVYSKVIFYMSWILENIKK